jgi:hypothetical protein
MYLSESVTVTIAVFSSVQCGRGGNFPSARIVEQSCIARHLGQHVEKTDGRGGNTGFIFYAGDYSAPTIEVTRFSGEGATAYRQDKKQHSDAIHRGPPYLKGVQIT